MAAACEIAQCVVSDHSLPNAAVRAFSSLQNCERDLHRWMRCLYGFGLQPYVLRLNLQIDSTKVRSYNIRVLAPHEILHYMVEMQSTPAFSSLFLGNLEDSDRCHFWRHVQSLPGWKSHPIFQDSVDLKRLIGFTIHGDGAVMKREDEAFVRSLSSCFSQEGVIKDPLLMKFPIAIIPERHMLSKDVAGCSFHIYFLEEFDLYLFWSDNPRYINHQAKNIYIS